MFELLKYLQMSDDIYLMRNRREDLAYLKLLIPGFSLRVILYFEQKI